MWFGYFTLTDNPPAYGAARRDPNALLNDVYAECILAEELGFNSVWVPEHHFGFFGCLPTPAVYLAHLAAKTSRIRLAPATVLLPCNQPLRVAEEYAMLDLLSHGGPSFPLGAVMINGSTTPLRFHLMKAERDSTRKCISCARR